jgi:hypothetical protein
MNIISEITKSTIKIIALTSLVFTLVGTESILAQQNDLTEQCVQCDNTTTTGLFSSAIGKNTIAKGDYSFVGGYSSEAEGANSIAFGNRAINLGSSSVALGQFVRIYTSTAMVLGAGHNLENPLINSKTRSLMIGFGSTKPTFFVGESIGVNSTGRIGIGNVTEPDAKLHIKSDDREDASLLLEPFDAIENMANLQLLDANSGLSARLKYGMRLFTNLGSMQFEADEFNFAGTLVNMPALRINNAYSLPVTVGNPGEFLSHNGTWAVPSGGGGGSSYWQPSGSTIYYNGGNVGIGTSDTKGYKLGVNGKIIATEVVVKYFSQWPDYVFEPSYPLMPLPELQEFVQTHRHLPDMPPAQQVAETGVPVGEMNALLLKKVEELTLYVLQQQKEIELLKQKLQD